MSVLLGKREQFLTLVSGPVLINEKKEVFLHRAESTGKFQFIGGRLSDRMSPVYNAEYRANADLGLDIEIEENSEPFIVQDKIEREGKEEFLVLMHYRARILKDEGLMEGDHGWFSLEKIKEMD